MTEPTGEENVSDLAASDQPTDSRVTELLKQVIEDKKQKYNQRATLFRVVIGIVVAAVLAIILLMLALVFIVRKVDNVVIGIFISSMTVQSFALIAIIARHLYPSEKDHQEVNGQASSSS